MSLLIPKNLLEEPKRDQHKNNVQPRFLRAKIFTFQLGASNIDYAKSLSTATGNL